MDDCEACFITDSILAGVAFERVYFLFGLEDPDDQFNFRNIFSSIYLILIRLVDFFIIFSI